MRILVQRRSGGLGDVVCLLPALGALRAARPGARIDLALPPEYAEFVRGRVDGVRVIAWDYRKFRPRWRRLLESRYDHVVDLSGPHVSPGRPEPNRIDYFLQRCAPDARGYVSCTIWYTNHDGGRRGERQAAPRLPVRDEERGWVRDWLAERGVTPGSRPVVALHLKSARAAKDWPLEKSDTLARRLLDRDVRVIALERSQRLDTPGIVGAHGLTVGRLAALIEACDLLVGPDSGPMHVAAAVGTPCVALFGPTDPGVILKHYGGTHVAVRRPHVADIPVDEVLGEVERTLGPPGRPVGAARRPEPRAKILFVSDKVYPETLGGAEISIHHLLRRLSKQGCETVTCKWHRHARRPLGEILSRHDPEWVFTQLRVAPDVVREAKLQGRRAAVFVRSLTEHVCGYRDAGRHVCIETGGRAEPLTCSLGCTRSRTDLEPQREMFRTADLVVCNSDYTRRVIERVFGGADERRGRVIVQYPPIRPPRRAGPMSRRYLTIVRPSPGKGQELFERLTRRLTDREFLVVGAATLDVPWDRVACLPVAANMDEVYRTTRILLQPAVNAEAFGRTVAEAAAFGVPSVVSNQGGLPEALGPGGLAIEDFENPEAWADAIGRVEKDYDRFSALAREHAKQFRSIDALLRALGRGAGAAARRPARPTPPTPTAPPAVHALTAGFPGVQGAFIHLAAVVPFVTARRFDPRRPPGPGLCVLGGWRSDYPAYVRRQQNPGVTFALSWHSSWNQIEQSGEWDSLCDALDLLRRGAVRRLFVSDRETAAVLARLAPGVEWLPDTLDLGIAERVRPGRVAGRDVDLFCPASPRKNICPQLAAVVGTGAALHVNDLFSSADRAVAEALGVRLVREGMPGREAYYRLIARMAAGLQVTLAESFNYVAAEHMLLGVPVLTSRHVPCRPDEPRLVVDDEHSPAAIRAKLVPLLDDPLGRRELGDQCREHIRALAAEHNRIATDVLRRATA